MDDGGPVHGFIGLCVSPFCTAFQLIAADAEPVEVKQAAAVNFKNYIKFHWAPRDAQGLTDRTPVPDSDKVLTTGFKLGVNAIMVDATPQTIIRHYYELSNLCQDQIKAHLTDLMLAAPPLVRAQLSEALSLISEHDFPAKWPTLLPGLLERLQTDDVQRLAGVLATADSIYQRYRNQFMTDSLSLELEYSQQMVKPLLATLKRLTPRATEAATPDAAQQALVIADIRSVVSIFYSLNSPGLTDAFEETLDDWMSEFHALLVLEVPRLAEKDPEKESVLDSMKATVCMHCCGVPAFMIWFAV